MRDPAQEYGVSRSQRRRSQFRDWLAARHARSAVLCRYQSTFLALPDSGGRMARHAGGRRSPIQRVIIWQVSWYGRRTAERRFSSSRCHTCRIFQARPFASHPLQAPIVSCAPDSRGCYHRRYTACVSSVSGMTSSAYCSQAAMCHTACGSDSSLSSAAIDLRDQFERSRSVHGGGGLWPEQPRAYTPVESGTNHHHYCAFLVGECGPGWRIPSQTSADTSGFFLPEIAKAELSSKAVSSRARLGPSSVLPPSRR